MNRRYKTALNICRLCYIRNEFILFLGSLDCDKLSLTFNITTGTILSTNILLRKLISSITSFRHRDLLAKLFHFLQDLTTHHLHNRFT